MVVNIVDAKEIKLKLITVIHSSLEEQNILFFI
jgi:hypothetical protein